MQLGKLKQGSFTLRSQNLLALIGGGFAVSVSSIVQAYYLKRLKKELLPLMVFVALQILYLSLLAPKLVVEFPRYEAFTANLTRIAALVYVGIHHRYITKKVAPSSTSQVDNWILFLPAIALEFTIRYFLRDSLGY